MIEFSERTENLLRILFDESESARLARVLLEEISENIPCCGDSTPVEMERIRFSVLRLIHQEPEKELQWIELAKIDWRDLFMAAGFGAVEGHAEWYAEVVDRTEIESV